MRGIIRQFLRREAHPAIQFIKYGMAGGLATAVDVVVFYFLAWLVFPALTLNDPMAELLKLDIRPVDELTRQRHFILDRVITFMFSNLTAYVANVLWVFEPGRHSRAKEIGLFYAVSATSLVVGTALGWALIRYAGASTTLSYVANVFASLMINYVCRKFIVFKG